MNWFVDDYMQEWVSEGRKKTPNDFLSPTDSTHVVKHPLRIKKFRMKLYLIYLGEMITKVPFESKDFYLVHVFV